MAKIEDRLTQLEEKVNALPRKHPRGCQLGRTFDPVRELLHVETCHAENCPRRDRFKRSSREERAPLLAAIRAELAMQEAEGNAS
jgi:alpha-D-ribose 1-methylphosphonate 5-triphosphate synthase subunit PhnI